MTIRTSGSEKRHVTVVLTVAADGFILPPMIIFWGKTSQTIKDIEAPEGFVIVTQEKAWMDESLMFIWFDHVWKAYVEKNQKELDFNRSIMVYDAFNAHVTYDMKGYYQSIAVILSWCSWLYFERSTTRCLYKQTF